MKLVITGTPGTGKTTLGKKLAAALHVPFFELNAFAKNTEVAVKEGPEWTVDLAKLQRVMNAQLRRIPAYVVEGHLACDMKLPADAVLVLRCNPLVLEKRLQRRKYSKAKVWENVLSEALDYSLVQSEGNYGAKKVAQLDCTRPVPVSTALRQLRMRKPLVFRWLPLLQDRM